MVRRFMVVLLTLVGCSTRVPNDNPYDPSAPIDKQVKGEITGSVASASGAAFDVDMLVIEVTGATPSGQIVSADVVREVTGQVVAFRAEIPGGTYRVHVFVLQFEPIDLFGVTVGPGETVDLGLLELQAGRGTLSGSVVARSPTAGDGTPPLDTRITAIRLVQPLPPPGATADCALPGAEEAVSIPLRGDGTFVATELAAGPYMVTAERGGYVPALSSGSVDVVAGEVANVGQLVLLLTENMIRITPAADPNADPSGLATSNLAVSLDLVVPPFYNGMRISEDPTFSDAGLGDTQFAAAQQNLTWTLTDGEGMRELFVQFRAPTCATSPVFDAGLVVDTTAPQPEPPALVNGATCTNDALVSLAIAGDDPCLVEPCAGLYQMQIAIDGILDSEPWVDYDTQYPVDLGSDGDVNVLVALRDRAGNTSSGAASTITVNTTGPAVGSPAILVDGGATTVRSLNVLLDLDVTGASEIEVGNGPGLDGSGWMMLPVTRQLAWRLADGADGPRQVVTRFRDTCGNVTQEYDVVLTLDRSAALTGSVRLEGETDYSGATVSFSIWDEGSLSYLPVPPPATTTADGQFLRSGLTAGTYEVQVSAAGFVTRTLDGLAVAEGEATVVPEITVAIARGTLQGRVLLAGETAFDGIRVEADTGVVTFTDANGNYVFTDLPVGDYLVSAQKGTAFQQGQLSAPETVTESGTTTAPDLTLVPVPGRIDGTALLQGRAVHAGIDVVLTGVTVLGTEKNASTVTDDAGTYQITDLTAGTYNLRFSASGFQTESLDPQVMSPGENLDLTVDPVVLVPAIGTISGTVEYADQTEHDGIRVAAFQGTTERAFTYTNSSGVFTLSVAAGAYTVRISAAGYGTVQVTSVIVPPDGDFPLNTTTLNPQQGDVRFVGVVGATNQIAGEVQITGSYPGATQARFCEDPAISDPDNFPINPGPCDYENISSDTDFNPITKTFVATECPDPGDPLAICDGQKTFWVRFTDGSTESEWFEMPIILDRQAPIGNVVIQPGDSTVSAGTVLDGGAAYTNDLNVNVAVVTDDDTSSATNDVVSGVALARLYRNPSDSNPVLVSTTGGVKNLAGIGLSGGADGGRFLILEIEDGAGNLSVTDLSPPTVVCPDPRATTVPTDCDGIFLDTTAPPSLAFSINPLSPPDMTAGEVYATTPLVQLGIDSTLTGLAEDEAVSADISNDPNFLGALTQPLSSPTVLLSWALAYGEGTQTVYIKVRDAAGNISIPFQDDIIVDLTAPETPVLTAVGNHTNDNTPGLIWGSVSGATSYRIQLSDSVDFPGTGPNDIDQSQAGTSLVPSTALPDGLYYWRVKAIDDAGLESAFSGADSFTVDTVLPDVPVLEAVADPTTDDTPTVTWSSVLDADKYEIELDTANTFDTGSLVQRDVSSAAWTTPALGDDTWYVRVRAVDAATNESAWATTIQFEVDTTEPANANPLAPVASATLTDGSVAFSWSAVADAAVYLLQISAGSSMTDIDQYEVTGTSRTVSLADGEWTYRVGTRDAAGNASDIGSETGVTFTVDATPPTRPVLSTVASPTNDATPTFVWTDESASGAVEYELVIDAGSNLVAATSFTPSSDLSQGTHTVKVAARDAAGNPSSYTPEQTFVVDLGLPTDPSSLAPADGTVQASGAVTLTWVASTDALSTVSYQVQISTASDFSTLTTDQTVASTSYSTSLGDGTYYWRVRAVDAAGNVSAWVPAASGQSLTVDTDPPGVPELVPVGTLVNSSPTLQWSDESASGAVSYDLEIDDDVGFGSPDVSTTVAATSYPTSLTPGTWYWRVRSRDTSGNTSAFSPADSFTLDTTPPNPPTNPSPADGFTTNNPSVAFTWTDSVGGADSYRVEVAYDSGFTSIAQSTTTTGTSVSFAFPDGDYFWRVVALDAAGNESAPAGETGFTVDTQAPQRPVAESSPSWLKVGDTTLDISWSDESDTGAVDYEYEVANDLGTVVDSGSTTSTTVSLTAPSPDGTFTWRVRALDTAGNASSWSPVTSVGVDTDLPSQPAFTSPADGEQTSAGVIELDWGTSDETVVYELQVGQENTFTNQVVVDRSLSATVSNESLAEGDYYWRVRAVDPAGNVSQDWTAGGWVAANARSFTIDRTPPGPPSFLPFPDLTNDDTPNFAWTTSTDAARYEIELSANADFSPVEQSFFVDSPRTNVQDGDYISPLGEQQYYVRVSALDGVLPIPNRSAPSAPLLVEVDLVPPFPQPCNIVTAVSMADAAAETRPTIEWPASDPVEGIAEYILEVWVDSGGGTFVFQRNVPGILPNGEFPVTFRLPSADALADQACYELRLKARDEAGNESPVALQCSNSQSGFTYCADTAAPGALTGFGLAATMNNPTNDPNLVVEWDRQQDDFLLGQNAVTLRLLAEDGVTELDWWPIPYAPAFTPGVDSHTFNAPWEGEFYIEIYSRDAAENTSPTQTTPAIVFDPVPPGLPFTLYPTTPDAAALRIAETQPTFAWSSADGATNYTVTVTDWSTSLQAAQYTGITDTNHQPAAPLADGVYLWDVTAFDDATNMTGPISFGPAGEQAFFEIDTTAPDPSNSLYYPAAGEMVSTVGLFFVFAETTTPEIPTLYTVEVYDGPPASATLVYTQTCELYPATPCVPVGPPTYPGPAGRVNAPGSGLGEGEYYWQVLVEDDLGNQSIASPNVSFFIDDTPPDLPIPIAPAPDSFVSVTSVTLDWAHPFGSDADRSKVFFQYFNGTLWEPIGAPSVISATTLDVTVVDDTRYRWAVAAIDPTDNESAATGFMEFGVDTQDPDPVANVSLSPGGRKVVATWTAAADNGISGLSHYEIEYSYASNFAGATSLASPVESVEITGLDNRREVWVRVRAVDNAGNSLAWGAGQSATVGFRDAVLAANYSPSSLAATTGAGRLFVAATRTGDGATGDDDLRVLSCAYDECADPGAWNNEFIDTGTEVHSTTTSLAVGPERVWVHIANETDFRVASTPPPWTITSSLVLDSGLTNVYPGSIAVGATRKLVTWGRRSGASFQRRVASCPHDRNCHNTLADWNVVTMNDAVGTKVGGGVLVATDSYALLAFEYPQTSEDVHTRIRRCTMTSECNALSDWAAAYELPPGGVSNVSPRQFVKTKNYLYLRLAQVDGNNPDNIRISRCQISDGCNLASEWDTGGILFNSPTYGASPTMAYTWYSLVMSWRDPASDELIWAECPKPDTVDCTAEANWRTARATQQLGARSPAVVGFGADAAVAWIDLNDRIMLTEPVVYAPATFGATGAGDEIRAAWSAMTDVDGTVVIYERSGSTWNFELALPDPLLDQTVVSYSTTTNQDVSARSLHAVDGLSNNAPHVSIRTSTSYDLDSVSFPSCGSTGCNFAVDGDNTWVYVAYNSSANARPHLAHCNHSSTDCSTSGHWQDIEITLDTGWHPTSVSVDGSRATVGMRKNGGGVMVAGCSYASGCDSRTNDIWTYTHAAGVSADEVEVAYGGSRHHVAWRESDGDVFLARCTSSCSNGLNWTTAAIDTGVNRGIGLASAGSYNGMVLAYDDRVELFRCSHSTTCATGAGTFVNLTGTISQPVEYATEIHMGNGRSEIVSVWDDELHYLTCPSDFSSCTDVNRWSDTVLLEGPDGDVVDVESSGAARNVLFSRGDYLWIGHCRHECWDSGQWSYAPLLYEPFRWSNSRNGTALWIDEARGRFGYTYGASGGEIRHVTGARSLQLDWGP